MSSKPPPTPWGELIRIAREARIPRMSVRAAAKLANARGQVVSAENWGHVERGYQPQKGGYRPVPGQPATVAHMAWVVGVSPERLRSAGNSEAATVLEEMIRQDGAATHSAGTRYDDPTDEYLSRTPGLSDVEAQGLIALARHFRQASSEQGSGSGR